MATISFKCDTCKRSLDVLENKYGMTAFGKCIITSGCRGRLYSTSRNAYTNRETFPAPEEELNDYFPRRIFFQFKQELERDLWRVKHDLGVYPAITVYKESNGTYDILNNDEYVVTLVNQNEIEVKLNAAATGIVHCISRSSIEELPNIAASQENRKKVDFFGTLSFAILKQQNRPVTDPPVTITDDTEITIEISLQEPNKEPILCEETINSKAFSSPWYDWNELLLRKRRDYVIRSKSIEDFIVFQQKYQNTIDIPNGTRLRILRMDYGNGLNDIYTKNVLLLLAKSPYQRTDKDLDNIIDVSEVNAKATHNYYVFINGELFSETGDVETIYPEIERTK